MRMAYNHRVPGTRDPRKRLVGVWLTPEQIARFNKVAHALGITRSELLRRLVTNQEDLLPRTARPTNRI